MHFCRCLERSIVAVCRFLLWLIFSAPALYPVSGDSGNVDAGRSLHLAALHNEADLAATLLEEGADANAVNADGATPLHYATGSARIVRDLLKHGANPNALSREKLTPLLTAVMRGDSYDVARLLVEAGANVNVARGKDGTDLITLAIFGGDLRTVRYLVEHGAKIRPPTSRDSYGTMEMAAYRGDVDLLRFLGKHGGEINEHSDVFGAPLNAALYSDNRAAAAWLIENGAALDVNSVEGHATPTMLFAAYNEPGDTTIARLLLSRRVDPNQSNDEGETALSFAEKRGSTPLVAYLREHGANETNLSASTKRTPQNEVAPPGPARSEQVRDAATRAVALLQQSSRVFLENRMVREKMKCISCHQQSLPALAYGLARERGIPVDEHELGRQLVAQVAKWSPRTEFAREMGDPIADPVIDIGYGLEGFAALHFAANATTDAFAHYLIGAQQRDGSWFEPDLRPPMEGGKMVGTAWAIRALQLYPPAGESVASKNATQRARRWLLHQHPTIEEDRTFQLFGLVWAGATPRELADFVADILRHQRPDGGWASLDTRESDAWATGTTLVALQRAGIRISDTVYQRGVEFLLRTQFPDGSWWVRSRTWPFQPHFDGGFPHGKDQWISAGATAWASAALLLTLPATVSPSELADANTLIAQFQVNPSARETSTSVADQIGLQPTNLIFSRDIQPIFERSCQKCHSGEKPKGEFSLASRADLLKGGQSGDPAVVPGQSNQSHLLRYVTDQVEDLEMPPLSRRKKYPALTEADVQRLREWIDAGAPWSETNQ